jgi:hypothetical protein
MKRHLLASVVFCCAMAAVAEAQDGRYVVLFGLDESRLDGAAQDVVAAAADEFRSTGSASISVVGHTDTSGNAAYNQALSERRVAAVTEKLIQFGVPPAAINGTGVGEDQPAVPTGDGVREEQNRRVDISIAAPPPPPPAPAEPAPEPPVAEAAPPPPPPPARWLASAGIFYGYNIEDDEATHSHLAGINLGLDYLVNNWFSVGIEQAAFYHFDTQDDGMAGRTMVGPNFHFGDENFDPNVGINFGGIYGDGFEGEMAAGPEIGFSAGIFNWKVAYDIPFNRDLDEGIVNTTIGALFRF